MYSYALLEAGCYYLIQENEDAPIVLIKINVETDQCVYISKYAEEEYMEWKKKTDPILDILELLSDEAVKEWEAVYNKDTYNYEEDDDY